MQIDVSAKKLSIPRVCPCCGGEADDEARALAAKTKGIRVVHTTVRDWTFPYCSECLDHVATWNDAEAMKARASSMFTVGLGLTALASGSVCLGMGVVGRAPAFFTGQTDALIFYVGVVAVIGTVLSIWLWTTLRTRAKDALARAQRMCSSACTAPFFAVRYVGWYGTVHSFDFASEDYGLSFAKANQEKLVNVSQHLWSRLHGR